MSTISKSTLKFLSDLRKNNNRDWFKSHNKEFKEEQQKTKDFLQSLLEKLKSHDDIENLKMFRIYRDVRFSKDKTPYKSHFAGHFVRATNKLRGGYYIHIKPGECFIGGGFWEPNKEDLLRIRKEFEIDSSEIKEIIEDENFVKNFGTLQGSSLKTAPRNFDKNHPNIELIRMKQFIVSRNFSDIEVLSPSFIDEVNKTFKAMRPFFDYMSDVLTTDLNGESIFID